MSSSRLKSDDGWTLAGGPVNVISAITNPTSDESVHRGSDRRDLMRFGSGSIWSGRFHARELDALPHGQGTKTAANNLGEMSPHHGSAIGLNTAVPLSGLPLDNGAAFATR